MKITGDQPAGLEILAVLNSWDKAICSLDMNQIAEHCAAEVNLFDVTMELQGLSSYQKVWSSYEDYFRTGLRVFRDQLNIHAEPDMAFVHGFCKIDVESGKPTPGVVWCRTTICLRKKSGKWKIIHQHVSLPHPVESIVSLEWDI